MQWHNNLESIDLRGENWAWLAYSHSLTKFLNKQAGKERLVIELLSQQWRVPSSLEQARLNLDQPDKIFDRKIVMTVINKPWIFARTYFTQAASDYLGQDLNLLASNSLGELIYNNYPNVSRGKFQFGYLDSSDSLFKSMIELLQHYNPSLVTDLYRDMENSIICKKLIIRRSQFLLDQHTILFNIDEVFMPVLINKMLKLEVPSF